MSDRIHDCLDGTIPLSALTDEERREVEKLEAAIESSLAFARQTTPPDVTAAVIERIRVLETETPAARTAAEDLDLLASVRRALEWLWAPRAVRLRPAWALTGIAVFALGLGLLQVPASESAQRAVLGGGSRVDFEHADGWVDAGQALVFGRGDAFVLGAE